MNNALFYAVVIALALGVIAFTIWLVPANAAVRQSSDLVIKEIKRVDLGDSQYRIVLNYCKNDINAFPVGILVKSDIGLVAIPVDTKINYGICQPYTTLINVSQQSSIRAYFFEKSDIPELKNQFEDRLDKFNANLLTAYQDLRGEKSTTHPDLEKIDRLEKNILKFEQTIRNTKFSLQLLASLG